MKLKIETPMASAPIVAAESAPQCPAMAVDTMPMSGTVMFETILGSAMRSISRFMFITQDRVSQPMPGGAGLLPECRRSSGSYFSAKIRQKQAFCRLPAQLFLKRLKSGTLCVIIRKNGLPLPGGNRLGRAASGITRVNPVGTFRSLPPIIY